MTCTFQRDYMVTNSGGQTLVFVVLAGCDMLGMVGWSVRVIPIAPPHPRPPLEGEGGPCFFD